MAGIDVFSSSTTLGSSKNKGGSIVYGRVVDILLEEGTDEKDQKKFNNNGGWSGIGTIWFKSVKTPIGEIETKTQGTRAFPYFPNYKHYPLIGEIVPIIFLPNPLVSTETATSTVPYYLPPTNMWNTVHQNANPYLPGLPPSQKKSYLETQEGSFSKNAPKATKISLGKTFVERDNIRDLLPFEGDVIMEGRWGNTLRLGSTVTSRNNPWSSVGKCGDPIIILRNRQNSINTTPSEQPELEDINQEGSSVYLTSTQAIPLQTPTAEQTHSSGKSSYHKYYPTPPSKYSKGTQAIISGDRVIINAKTDHVIIDAGLTLSFNAQKGFNFDTPKNFVVKTGTTIRLGKEFAPHPVLKGDITVEILSNIVQELIKLITTMQSTSSLAFALPPAAITAVPRLTSLLTELKTKTKSNKTYTL